MAATLVGGAFLSATVQTLLEKLASAEFRDYIKNTKLNDLLLWELKTKLLTLQVVLDDAEKKQIVGPKVKDWVDHLKDAILDTEDLLDRISYDSLRFKVEKNTEVEVNITNRFRNLLSPPFKNFYGDINSQMNIMGQKLQSFVQQIVSLGLQTRSGGVSRITRPNSVVNESVMVGREGDKERLMNMLLSDDGTSNNNIGVVAIVGMGGVGKTTLARLLCKDKEVKEHFDEIAWVCVSDFDIQTVIKTLLESLNSSDCKNNNLDLLQAELTQKLRDKRFLLVLDDLWNDNYGDWDELVSLFRFGRTGSRVILTTRQQNIAEVRRTFPIHQLAPLSNEDCWSLLSEHAFRSEDFRSEKYPDLEVIGKKIARRCGGLPIAAKSLGGLLRSKVDEKKWTEILNSNIWHLPNNNIQPALFLSYQYLPSYLKRCFAYCSNFPKDYPLNRRQLVLLWMAEGFLDDSQSEKVGEEVGDDYFVELLSRSLIQQINDDVIGQRFVMHDLVHDLATHVSGKSSCRLGCVNISENIRHLSYTPEFYDISKKFEDCYKFECLRSFLPLSPYPFGRSLSKKVIDKLPSSFKRLRVLSLSNYRNITIVPNSVGNLVHLRYLDLSRTGIRSLPDLICNLYNLQTLLLSGCRSLTELPVNIGKLVNLRHLDISGTNIKEMPIQIVGLENLQTLTVFVVGKQQVGLNIKELRKFRHLRGNLSIKNLHNVVDAMEAYDADLKSKEQIEELTLEWGRNREIEDSEKEKAVLEMLQPSTNVKRLTINYYGGTSFPSWLGDSLFSNMEYLCISHCEYCAILPPLGQLPSLKELIIGDMKLETIGPEFYGMTKGGSVSSFQPFQSLECLKFENMLNWMEWLPFESGKFPFPQLKTLHLKNCPKLRGHLPNHLSSIVSITIRDCDHLLATIPSLHWLSSIKSIYIDSQSTFRLFPARDFPDPLQDVGGYRQLSLNKIIQSSTCLTYLELNGFPSLTTFPADGLPKSLESLSVFDCENLTLFPPETWSNYTSLTSLSIKFSCNSLTSFPLDGFPTLKRLTFRSCSSLESIFISESSSNCQSSLQLLWVEDCGALRSLPKRMDTLTALEDLVLRNLHKPELSFHEGTGLPSKLRSIEIDSLSPAHATEWGLQDLTALSRLSIEGDDIVNTLLKERLLPICLVSLYISGLSKMKSLEGNGLRHLSSLKNLGFYRCPRLESLQERLPSSLESLHFNTCPRLESLQERLPSSLKSLMFHGCPRLESLPEEDTLPSSLELLSIAGCPLLEAKYESQRGTHWSNIAHIPVLKIHGELTI